MASAAMSAVASGGDAEAIWKPRPVPPSPWIIGYAHDASSPSVEEAIEAGANVICWSFVDMVSADAPPDERKKRSTASHRSASCDDDGGGAAVRPAFETDLDLDRIRSVRSRHESVLHVAAIGGWNGPHPPPGPSGVDWCRAFVEFNSDVGHLFDGIDWDLEGHNDRAAPTSKFSMETLDVMADFSKCAKEEYGMSVSMAPAESYLDALDSGDNDKGEGVATVAAAPFSLDLNLPSLAFVSDPADRNLMSKVGFAHAGRQCYAYVLRRAGFDVFDWVSLQLYESYSRFVHDTTRRKPVAKTSTEAIVERIEALSDGSYVVDLPRYGVTTIRIPLGKIVMGVANGWADGVKSCQVEPTSLGDAMRTVESKNDGEGYGGAMFWTIDEEGKNGVRMAAGLADALL